jgi:hypothetical protein
MQYTIRGVLPAVDRALRQRAKERSKSLNETVLDALSDAAGLGGAPYRRRDVSDLAGTWEDEEAVLDALADQHHIDEGLWA